MKDNPNFRYPSKCDHCEKVVFDLEKEDGWEMQHLHFSDTEITYLTCDKCKLISPMEYLDKLQKKGMH